MFILAAVAANARGDVYIAGRMGHPVDFGGGLRTALVGGGYVAAYGPGGRYRWDAVLTEPGRAFVRDVAAAADRVVLTGRLEGTVDLGGGERSSEGADDAFALVLRD